MANFLSRLAARATGVANVARPIVPALFSPESGLEESRPPAEPAAEKLAKATESRFSSFAGPEPTLPKPEDASTGVAPESRAEEHPLYKERRVHHESLQSDEPRPLRREEAISSPAANPVPPVHPAEDKKYVPGQVLPALPPEVLPALAPAEVFPVLAQAQNQLSRSEPVNVTAPIVAETQPARREQPSAVFSSGPTVPANRRTLSPRSDHRAIPTQQPPVVRVTIGRIDVRAQFSSPAQQVSATRHQRQPALSLEEYIKQRREGKR